MGTAGLPSLDPFDEVDPLVVRSRNEIFDNDLLAALSINNDRLEEGCTTVQNEEDGDDSEWEDPNEDGSAFDISEDDDE